MEKKTYRISVRLGRTIVEYAFVSVPMDRNLAQVITAGAISLGTAP